jgi:hypothetical protein
VCSVHEQRCSCITDSNLCCKIATVGTHLLALGMASSSAISIAIGLGPTTGAAAWPIVSITPLSRNQKIKECNSSLRSTVASNALHHARLSRMQLCASCLLSY